MWIKMRCNYCGEKMVVKTQLAGRHRNCPFCHSSLEIPHVPAKFDVPPAGRQIPADPSKVEPVPITPGRQSKRRWITAVSGACFVSLFAYLAVRALAVLDIFLVVGE